MVGNLGAGNSENDCSHIENFELFFKRALSLIEAIILYVEHIVSTITGKALEFPENFWGFSKKNQKFFWKKKFFYIVLGTLWDAENDGAIRFSISKKSGQTWKFFFMFIMLILSHTLAHGYSKIPICELNRKVPHILQFKINKSIIATESVFITE